MLGLVWGLHFVFVHCPHGTFLLVCLQSFQGAELFRERLSLALQKYIVGSAESLDARIEVQLSLKGLFQH